MLPNNLAVSVTAVFGSNKYCLKKQPSIKPYF